MRPFDAEPGSVWAYEKDTVDEELFMVLDEYSNDVDGEHFGKPFRRHLSLKDGVASWFADESHMNYKSARVA